MALETILRYWHTLRHLRPVQIYGRIWFRLRRPRPDTSPAPPIRHKGRTWQVPVRRQPVLAGPAEFSFLGQDGTLAEVGWDGPERDMLWRYNQHYFDDLNARDAAARANWHHDLLVNWVKHNPPGTGCGWDPYPTSLRIVNWIKWTLAGNTLPAECVESLAVQARWLTKRLEYHLLGNHLFSNAKALVFAGLFFEGKEVDRWLATGLKILRPEVPEQILADGGHFERSTMYHALALEDALDLINIGQAPGTDAKRTLEEVLEGWRQIAPDMLHWLDTMCHPDGEISFFNDAAFDIAPPSAELRDYAARLGIVSAETSDELTLLEPSGYARLKKSDAVLLLDVAPVGPDYQPGHAHADTLSFELSLFGQRILVNSGTSCYGTSPERHRQRGTAAHNTVMVNGENSSEVWSGFRVARRAVPTVPVINEDEALVLSCSHNGYRRLPGQPVHERTWTLADNQLIIADRVHGPHKFAEARFHFHPDVHLTGGESEGQAMVSHNRQIGWKVDQGVARIEPATWHPRFGASIANSCLVIALEEGRSRLQLSWK